MSAHVEPEHRMVADPPSAALFPPNTPRFPDPEVAAIDALAQVLALMDAEARARAIRWAADRYGVTL